MTDALTRALMGLPRNPFRAVPVTIAGTGPLTVTLPDGTTVNALAITGLTYTVTGTGVAFISEGTMPVVLPTS